LEPILIIGIIIFIGFLLSEICIRLGLPKVTGYIIAGIILNPDFTNIIPGSFVTDASLVTNIALAFITFSVGGTLSFSKLRLQGKSIIAITLFEAELAFICVAVIFILIGPLIIHHPVTNLVSFYIPFSILLASLASPTDPSATLAVVHELKAKGQVTSTILSVAAFDDILGIVNFSLAMSAADILILHQAVGINLVAQPIFKILGSIFIGSLFGLVLNILTKIINNESEGVLITLIISLLSLCFGLAGILHADELLSTMTMGVIVANFNIQKDQLFNILERYTEELIFALFFTISAMHLKFSVLAANYLTIVIFIIFRAIGKYSGVFVGGKVSNSSGPVRTFTAGGLIPQGGIVIGLALVIRQNPAYESMSDIILNVIIGATVIHELIGPIVSKYFLKKAGEINSNKTD
jgi:Kef-type K+ transport system membrane component KefB